MDKILTLRAHVIFMLIGILAFSSCSKVSSDIVPQTSTHFLTNGEDKRWFKFEDRYIETDVSIPAPECTMDDLDVFVVNNTIYKEYGGYLCESNDAPILNGTWKFMDDERFILKSYTQNGNSYSDTLQILLLTENQLILKKPGQDLIKSIYYPRP